MPVSHSDGDVDSEQGSTSADAVGVGASSTATSQIPSVSSEHARDGVEDDDRVRSDETDGDADGDAGNLRKRLDNALRETQVYSTIQAVVSEYLAEKPHARSGPRPENGNTSDNDDNGDSDSASDVINTLLAALQIEPEQQQHQHSQSRYNYFDHRRGSANNINSTPPIDRTKQLLSIRVLPGRAFVTRQDLDVMDNVNFTNAHSNSDDSTPTPMWFLYLHLGEQRLMSEMVPMVDEPAFDQTFEFALPLPAGSSAESLLELENKALHILLLRTTPGITGTTELIASHELEWRRALSRRNGASVAVELTSCAIANSAVLPVGVLTLQLSFTPALHASHSKAEARVGGGGGVGSIAPARVRSRLDAESARGAAPLQRFYRYAKVWWQEYVDIATDFRHRDVRIFVPNEWGENRPVCSLVTPLQAGRELDSPFAAARFVSLIPYVLQESVGGGGGGGGGHHETWYSLHALLSVGHADCENHALLLCCLLLGFGLRAFVCVGTAVDQRSEKPHVWVATIASGGDGSDDAVDENTRVTTAGKGGGETAKKKNNARKQPSPTIVTFWESLTGQRVRQPHLLPSCRSDAKNGHCYSRISCMFNHESFYANRQSDNRVVGSSFRLNDASKWKSMDQRLLNQLPKPRYVPLKPNRLDHSRAAEAIECALRGWVETHRSSQLNLSTSWQDDLSYYLSPSLVAYEAERLSGTNNNTSGGSGNAEFQQVIKTHIPRGYSFKGFPVTFNHCDPRLMFDHIASSQVGSRILQTTGEHVSFAIRVRVFPYPEATAAVWVMLATTFRQ